MLLRPSLLVLVAVTSLCYVCIPSIQENTFLPLSFSELVSKAVHLYGPPVSNNQYNPQYHLFPCLNFTCHGRIQKLWFVAQRQSQFPDTQPPTFHILRKYQGPEYCGDTGSSDIDCEYYLWLRLNWTEQQPILVYENLNDTVGVYETILTANNSFETGDILGVFHPINASLQVLYQREGRYCDTLGDITIHLFGGHLQTQHPRQDPVLPYIAIETDTSSQHCAMGFLKKESLQVIVDAPRDSGVYDSLNVLLSNAQSMPISMSGLLVKFFIAAKFDHTISSGWPALHIRRRNNTSDALNLVLSTTMEPRSTGYLNVFEYNVQNRTFNIQHNDVIRVFWPPNMNASRRYSLAYFRDSANVMLSIEIGQTVPTTLDDSTSTPDPLITTEKTKKVTTKSHEESTTEPKGEQDTTTMSSIDKTLDGITTDGISSSESHSTFMLRKVTTVTATPTSTSVSESSTKAQTQVAVIVGGVLCAMAVVVLLVVLFIAVFVMLRCRNHTKGFSPNTNDLKTLPPVLDNPTYSLVDDTNGDNQRASTSNGAKPPNSTVASQGLYARDGDYKLFEWGVFVPTADQREAASEILTNNTEMESIYSTLGESQYSTLQQFNRAPEFFSESDGDYWEPASDTKGLYEQLSSKKYREILRNQIQLFELQQLGSGQFGNVMKGVWLLSGGSKDVAVKILKEGSSEDDKIKFIREAAIHGQFWHPNIVKLMGVVTVGEPAMIVLEFLPNGDLRSYLMKMQPTPGEMVSSNIPLTLLRFCKEIVSGMKYLERKKFVHRDLAARNILLSEEKTCKISDFGMSRGLENDSYYVSRGGMIPVKWTAPEALHYKTYSSLSDVWSFGCVVYEIWSLGHKPFEGYTNREVISKVDSGFRLPPPPSCPRDIYHIMIQCWHPNKNLRPSFSDLHTSLSDHTLSLGIKEESQIVAERPDQPLPLPLHPQAHTIGAPLEAGKELYNDLQNMYLNI